MSTAQDLPLAEPRGVYGAPALRLVPSEPLDFDEAVRRVRPRLHRYAVRRLGDVHEAEELVQEALLRAYTHREGLLTEEDLSAWTTVVTGRLVIDRLRVRGRSTSVADVPETGRVGRDTADVVVARDEARTALDALDAMPTRQASLLWAREVEGHSYQELCDRFGMTEPAVRSVLTRARKALRKEYASRGGTLPVGGLAVLAPWIAGLSWAEKLRRAATRVTGPAALGAVGITTLGGLLLSPFGLGAVAPGHSTFSPAQAVVTAQAVGAGALDPAPRHGFTLRPAPPQRSVASAPGATVRAQAAPRPDGVGAPVDTFCPVGTAAQESPGAGGKTCSAINSKHRVYVDVPLPEAVAEATGYRYINVETSDDLCAYTPTNPLIKCDRTQP